MASVLKSIMRSLGVATDKQCDYSPNVATYLAALRAIAPVADRGSYAFKGSNGGCVGFVQFIVRSSRAVEIHRLWTREPGRGNGTAMLRSLCELADEHRVEIRLKVLPIGRKPYPMSREQLRDWYRKYGFEGDGWKLVRKPATGKTCGTADKRG
jgi:hypothetical protein